MPPRDLKDAHNRQRYQQAAIATLTDTEIAFMTKTVNDEMNHMIKKLQDEITNIDNKTGGNQRKRNERAARKTELTLARNGLMRAKQACDANRAATIFTQLESSAILSRTCQQRLASCYASFNQVKAQISGILNGCDLTMMTNTDCLEMVQFTSWSENLSEHLQDVAARGFRSMKVTEVLAPVESFEMWGMNSNISFIQHLEQTIDSQKDKNGFMFNKLYLQAEKEFATENIDFLIAMSMLHRETNPFTKADMFQEIYYEFINVGSPREVNLSYDTRVEIAREYHAFLSNNRVELPDVDTGISEIVSLVRRGTFTNMRAQEVSPYIQEHVPIKPSM